MFELTYEQAQAMEKPTKGLLHVLNPRTREAYLLVRQAIYELARSMVGGPNRRGWAGPEMDDYEENPNKP